MAMQIGDWFRNCRNCAHAERFDPRSDETFTWGCTAPGWEGYVDPDSPHCSIRYRWCPGTPKDKRKPAPPSAEGD